jgi:hypothetical protein
MADVIFATALAVLSVATALFGILAGLGIVKLVADKLRGR